MTTQNAITPNSPAEAATRLRAMATLVMTLSSDARLVDADLEYRLDGDGHVAVLARPYNDAEASPVNLNQVAKKLGLSITVMDMWAAARSFRPQATLDALEHLPENEQGRGLPWKRMKSDPALLRAVCQHLGSTPAASARDDWRQVFNRAQSVAQRFTTKDWNVATARAAAKAMWETMSSTAGWIPALAALTRRPLPANGPAAGPIPEWNADLAAAALVHAVHEGWVDVHDDDAGVPCIMGLCLHPSGINRALPEVFGKKICVSPYVGVESERSGQTVPLSAALADLAIGLADESSLAREHHEGMAWTHRAAGALLVLPQAFRMLAKQKLDLYPALDHLEAADEAAARDPDGGARRDRIHGLYLLVQSLVPPRRPGAGSRGNFPPHPLPAAPAAETPAVAPPTPPRQFNGP